MYQQQENQKFMSHFHKKFVIRYGCRNLALHENKKYPELFNMRANGSAVCNRTIQIDCRAEKLNSAFYYILCYPNASNLSGDNEENTNGLFNGKIFIWEGNKTDLYYEPIAEMV